MFWNLRKQKEFQGLGVYEVNKYSHPRTNFLKTCATTLTKSKVLWNLSSKDHYSVWCNSKGPTDEMFWRLVEEKCGSFVAGKMLWKRNQLKKNQTSDFRCSRTFLNKDIRGQKQQLMVLSREGGRKHVPAVTCSESPPLVPDKAGRRSCTPATAAARQGFLVAKKPKYCPTLDLQLKSLGSESELIWICIAV